MAPSKDALGGEVQGAMDDKDEGGETDEEVWRA